MLEIFTIKSNNAFQEVYEKMLLSRREDLTNLLGERVDE
jgi:hypothetical protein